MCRAHSLLTFLHVCVVELPFLSIHLSCDSLICSMLTPCILESLVVSFLCRRFPWVMPVLLDVPVGTLLGRDVWALCAHPADWLGLACPPHWLTGSCLPTGMTGPCLPTGLIRSAGTLFPFAVRVMLILSLCCEGYVDVLSLLSPLL